MRVFAGVVLMGLLLVGSGFTQTTFLVSPDRSQVVFSLGDVLHQVHGTFHVQNGKVQFDHGSAQLSGSIVVAAGSGKSGNQTRDHRMTVDILNAPQFAEATFTPTHMDGSIAPTGASTVQVAGVFTLHGAAHDLTLPMQIHIDGMSCTARTHFSIPYVKWGMKDPSTLFLRVNKDVDINLTLVGQVSSTPTH